MIRGTTPLHTFRLTFDAEFISKVRILYAQNDTVVLAKETEDCNLEGSAIKVKLTQEDTLAFDSQYPVEIQVRVLLTDGNALASKLKKVTAERCLDNEVLE